MPRIAYGRNKTQVDLSLYPDNTNYPIGTGEWNQDPEDGGILGFTKQSATLSSNTFSPIATLVEITGETATDDIDSIGITNTNEFDLLYVLSASGQTITLKHTNNSGGAGEIVLLGTVDKAVSNTVPTILIRDDSSGVAKWYEWGGGITNSLSDVGNVSITSNSAGEVLKWNGSNWINNTLAEADIGSATDLALKAPLASPTFTGTATFNDLTVNGTNTIINSTTLTVDDKNIEIASVATPTDTTADGGGITIKGATDKTIAWTSATGDFDVSEHLDIASGKSFKIGGTDIISTSQTLSNKTINATNNTLTDTGTATGDVLKSNGTKFVKLARGTAGQALKVNSGGSDLEWGDVSSSLSTLSIDSSKSWGLYTISDLFLEPVTVSGSEAGVVSTEVYAVGKINIGGTATLTVTGNGEVNLI